MTIPFSKFGGAPKTAPAGTLPFSQFKAALPPPKSPGQPGQSQTSASLGIPDIPYIQGGGFGSKVLNVGIGAGNVLKDIGVGIGTAVAKTGLGLGKFATDVNAGAAGLFGMKKTQAFAQDVSKKIGDISSAVYDKPFQANLSTAGGKTGNFTGVASTILAPSDLIAGAKNAVAPVSEGVSALASKLPLIGKAVGWTAEKLINALPEAGFGYTYGRTQGETPKQAGISSAIFGGLSGAGEIAGDTYRAIRGDLETNIGKAVGFTGKTSVSALKDLVPKAINAFKTISNVAKEGAGIMVEDANGVEKRFDPTKSTFMEMGQALSKVKNLVYDQYTQLAQKAGDAGSVFSASDFGKSVNTLKGEMENTTSAFRSRASSLLNDMEQNFGVKDPKTGEVSFKNVPLTLVQDFVQKLNTDINPLSDKAGSAVTQKLSQNIRNTLDSKISSATGEGYQALRNAYSDLKSIENGVVNQTKKALRGSGSTIGNYVEGFGGLDTLFSALRGDVLGTIKGVGESSLGAVMKYLKNADGSLQRAFQLVDPAPQSSTLTRIFGSAGDGVNKK